MCLSFETHVDKQKVEGGHPWLFVLAYFASNNLMGLSNIVKCVLIMSNFGFKFITCCLFVCPVRWI